MWEYREKGEYNSSYEDRIILKMYTKWLNHELLF